MCYVVIDGIKMYLYHSFEAYIWSDETIKKHGEHMFLHADFVIEVT